MLEELPQQFDIPIHHLRIILPCNHIEEQFRPILSILYIDVSRNMCTHKHPAYNTFLYKSPTCGFIRRMTSLHAHYAVVLKRLNAQIHHRLDAAKQLWQIRPTHYPFPLDGVKYRQDERENRLRYSNPP